MAFRKRNIGIGRTPTTSSEPLQGGDGDVPAVSESLRGTRPSPLTGQPTTSTGAYSLDSLLGGHAGLALGSSLFIEENGTTDFAGALLRYYAAEGIVHGHTVHIVGVGEQWVKELPGLVGASKEAEAMEGSSKKSAVDSEKMKIAWRYERLGQADADRASRGASHAPAVYNDVECYSSPFQLLTGCVMQCYLDEGRYRMHLKVHRPRQIPQSRRSVTHSTSQRD